MQRVAAGGGGAAAMPGHACVRATSTHQMMISYVGGDDDELVASAVVSLSFDTGNLFVYACSRARRKAIDGVSCLGQTLFFLNLCHGQTLLYTEVYGRPQSSSALPTCELP